MGRDVATWMYEWEERNQWNQNPLSQTLSISSAERKGQDERVASLAVLTEYGWRILGGGNWNWDWEMEMYQDTPLAYYGMSLHYGVVTTSTYGRAKDQIGNPITFGSENTTLQCSNATMFAIKILQIVPLTAFPCLTIHEFPA